MTHPAIHSPIGSIAETLGRPVLTGQLARQDLQVSAHPNALVAIAGPGLVFEAGLAFEADTRHGGGSA